MTPLARLSLARLLTKIGPLPGVGCFLLNSFLKTNPMHHLTKMTILALVCSVNVPAGPFGLTMGLTTTSLPLNTDQPDPNPPFEVFTKKVPEPDLNFVHYKLTFGSSGLAHVVGSTGPFRSDSSGRMFVERFKEIGLLLVDIYGEPSNKYAGINKDSKHKAPEEWMISLQKKDRFIAAYWFPKDGKTLPDNIASIRMEGFAIDEFSGWIELTYEFNNWISTVEEIKNHIKNTQRAQSSELPK